MGMEAILTHSPIDPSKMKPVDGGREWGSACSTIEVTMGKLMCCERKCDEVSHRRKTTVHVLGGLSYSSSSSTYECTTE